MNVVEISPAKWAVIDNDGKIVSEHDTNASAWRALDRLMHEPISKREDTADWIARKQMFEQ